MPGNKSGALRASKTNKEKYGEDFYKRIGAAGGKKGTTGGFAANPELASKAGRIGGLVTKKQRMERMQRAIKQDTMNA